MIVGELVKREARDSSRATQSLAYLDWLQPIFERVGIWDAEVLSVQRSYGKIHAIGLSDREGNVVMPEAGDRVIVLKGAKNA